MTGDPRKDERERPNPVEEELQTLARGREDRTLFVLFAGVNAVLLGLVLVIALVALLAWWLA
ncbi:MAG: hypothetical protein ACRDNB_08875 [Gaiellaceae bacterium]